MSTFGTPESVYEDNARQAAWKKKYEKAAKSEALKKKMSHKTDWAKHNRETGGKSVKGFEKYTG